jgi:membrane protein YdbS with pleckstrin-like domain
MEERRISMSKNSNKDNKLAKYTVMASLVSSLVLVGLFASLSVLVNSSRNVELYSQVDIIAGMAFVFVLSMIVSASVWPAVIEKKLKPE